VVIDVGERAGFKHAHGPTVLGAGDDHGGAEEFAHLWGRAGHAEAIASVLNVRVHGVRALSGGLELWADNHGRQDFGKNRLENGQRRAL